MSKFLSVSPQFGGFVLGFKPETSDLEDLLARQQRELSNSINQFAFHLLAGEVDNSHRVKDEASVDKK